MKTISFRLKPGQFLKEEIDRKVKEHGIVGGVILSAVGGLENVVLRMAGALPDNQPIKKVDAVLEIVSMTGTVSKNGSHMHISVSDKEGLVIGGHLKDGCKVKYTAEIVIGILENTVFTRELDEETGFKELNVSKE